MTFLLFVRNIYSYLIERTNETSTKSWIFDEFWLSQTQSGRSFKGAITQLFFWLSLTGTNLSHVSEKHASVTYRLYLGHTYTVNWNRLKLVEEYVKKVTETRDCVKESPDRSTIIGGTCNFFHTVTALPETAKKSILSRTLCHCFWFQLTLYLQPA